MNREHSDFIRRVANGEVYTGTSGVAMARWAIGWDEDPTDRPHDRGDFARCMNVYWAAPVDLRPKMRQWLTKQAWNLSREADKLADDGDWRRPVVDFETPAHYPSPTWNRGWSL